MNSGMVGQGEFRFEDTPPAAPPPGPVVPVSGTSPEARHASWTGARAVVHTWTERQSAYLQLVGAAGAISDHEAAAVLRCQLCSVNSVRGALELAAEKRGDGPMFVADGFDLHEWTDTRGTRRVTKRTRWPVTEERPMTLHRPSPQGDGHPGDTPMSKGFAWLLDFAALGEGEMFPDDRLADVIGQSESDRVELREALEHDFSCQISPAGMGRLQTVSDVVAFIEAHQTHHDHEASRWEDEGGAPPAEQITS